MARKTVKNTEEPTEKPLDVESAILQLEMVESCAKQFGVPLGDVYISPVGIPFASPRSAEAQRNAESAWEKMSLEVHANQKPLKMG